MWDDLDDDDVDDADELPLTADDPQDPYAGYYDDPYTLSSEDDDDEDDDED